jgi:heat-inducible transcriptional repressor
MGQILASLSGYIALLTFPKTEIVRLRHLKLIPLADQQLLMILVTDAGNTHSVAISLPTEIRQKNLADLEQEVEILSNILNHHLQGKCLSDLSHLNLQELDHQFSVYAGLLNRLQRQLKPLLRQRTKLPLVVHGVSKVIRQPEFAQLEQVQMLLSLLEQEQEELSALMFDPDRQTDGTHQTDSSSLNLNGGVESRPVVTLRIGSENPIESMHPCTLISAFYRQRGKPVGSVSILGPTRMLYQQAIPLVEQAAEYLSGALSQN